MGRLIANGGATDAGFGSNIIFSGASTADHATIAVNGATVSGGSWASLDFFDHSTAAQSTISNNGGTFGGFSTFDVGGELRFHNVTSAAQSVITNYGGSAANADGSLTRFMDSSTASSAIITNNGGAVQQAYSGATAFYDQATAADSLIITNGGAAPSSEGGATLFLGQSTAGSATLIANPGKGQTILAGGQIVFSEDSTGGMARVEIFGNAMLNIRQHTAPGVTIGSLEGTGLVYLGGNTLSIGSNNLNTEFSGIIQDGGPFGDDPTGGSIAKVGTGTLVLDGQHTFTGQVTVSAGKLIINGSVLTPVIVNGGILGGNGHLGAVAVQSGGIPSPGGGGGVLHVHGNLALSLGAVYLVELDGGAAGTKQHQISVAGTVVLGNAELSLIMASAAQTGATYVVLDNDSNSAINGTFANLNEGAVFVADNQAFSITYRGGDGNDVAVTALVPEPRTWILLALGMVALVLSALSRKKDA